MIRNLLAWTGLLAIVIAAAIALQAHGYFDDVNAVPPRVKVSYADLDLATPAGIHKLEKRVNRAIDDVCPWHAEDNLTADRVQRDCREAAIAGVDPQIRNAVAAAEDRARPGRTAYIDDRPLPPPPPQLPPPPPLVEPSYAPPPPPARLVRRTVVTTRTVTRTRYVPAAAPVPHRAFVPHPVVQPLGKFSPAYARRPEVPGSWLPPAAWSAIDRATVRAFATGRLTRWFLNGREGYVTVSDARRVDGLACRNVRAVKYSDGRQIVVADGMRCRLPGGGLISRACRY